MIAASWDWLCRHKYSYLHVCSLSECFVLYLNDWFKSLFQGCKISWNIMCLDISCVQCIFFYFLVYKKNALLDQWCMKLWLHTVGLYLGPNVICTKTNRVTPFHHFTVSILHVQFVCYSPNIRPLFLFYVLHQIVW